MDAKGFQDLLEEMVRQEAITVTKSARINGLVRENNIVKIHVVHNNGKSEWKQFNFIVWSPEMRKSVRHWVEPSFDEHQMFLRPTTKYVVKTLIDDIDVRRGTSPVQFNFGAVNNASDHKDSLTIVDTFGAVNGYSGRMYQINFFTGSKEVRSSVFSQYSDTEPVVAVFNNHLRTTLISIGATKVDIKETKVWRYFTHYKHQVVTNGMLWAIIKIQGKKSMWYIGSSVCFDSIKSEMEYNKMLVSNMIRPTS